MEQLARKVNIHHAAMQGAFFIGFSAIVGFGPVLLLSRGLSNSALGAVTSASLLIPCFLQLALASCPTRTAASRPAVWCWACRW